jgi:hypothetical protein
VVSYLFTVSEPDLFLTPDALEPLYNTKAITVTGNATSSYTVEIYVNADHVDSTVAVSDKFTFLINLTEGVNIIYLRLLDSSGSPAIQSSNLKTTLDTTPPEVTNTKPVEDEASAPVDTSIVITMNERIDFIYAKLTVNGGGGKVAGDLTYDDTTYKLNFVPSEALKPNTTYTVDLQVSDLAGNSMSHGFEFTTAGGAVPDDDDEPDLDGDGLPDAWEESYFADITEYGAEDDPDEDGYTNLEEYTAGTDPTDDTSHPGTEPEPDDDTGGIGMFAVGLILIPIILIIIIIIIVVVVISRKRKKEEEEKEEEKEPEVKAEEPKKEDAKVKEKEPEGPPMDEPPDIEAVEAEIVGDSDIFQEKAISKREKRTGAARPMKKVAKHMDDLDSWNLDTMDEPPKRPQKVRKKVKLSISAEEEMPEEIDDPYRIDIMPDPMSRPIMALPPATVFESQSKDYPKVDEIFVMTADGILLKHFSYMDTTLVDEDILSSMLTVIQNFVSDSFGQKGSLKQLRLGEFNILITQGAKLNVVAISTAADLEKLEEPFDKMIKNIEEINEAVLVDWDGSPDSLQGIEEHVTKMINGEY